MLSKHFGSEIYDAYTATDAWNSVQAAHAALGFGGTAVLTSAVLVAEGNILWGLFFLIVPLLRDSTDVVVDYVRARGDPQRRRSFPAEPGELVVDALTDTLFWAIGIAFAMAVMLWAQQPVWQPFAWIAVAAIAVLVGLTIVWPLPHYRIQKGSFDRAGLPYHFRLATFDGNFRRRRSEAAIRRFIARAGARRHLVICGPRGSRKTALAAGIGSDLTAGRRCGAKVVKVRYLSAAKLVEDLELGADGPTRESEPHAIHECGILIVDDLLQDLALRILALGEAGAAPAQRLQQILAKPIVWVLTDEDYAVAWRDQLRQRLGRATLVLPVVLDNPGAQPPPRHFSLLRGDWMGVLPIVAVAIPGAMLAWSISTLLRWSAPFDPWLWFGAIGLALALGLDAIALRRGESMRPIAQPA